MSKSKAWQAGFDAARQWEQSVASFWMANDYGSPPKAPKNPYPEDEIDNVWYWQGDGYDHPESMGESMVVVIRASDLKQLINKGNTDESIS